jgi:trimeric autotransporter adhesin
VINSRQLWMSRSVLLSILFLASLSFAPAQASLSLSSAMAPVGGSVSLDLSLASAVTLPAGLEWTFAYSPADFTSISVTPGPSAAGAAKSLTCNGANGSYTCLLSGLNTNTIPIGVVATGNLTLSSSANLSRPIQITNLSSATPTAMPIAISATGGLVTSPAPVTLTSLACTPASLTGPGTSACTVTLSGPAPTGGAAVALTSNNASLTVPASVTVAAAATTGSFTATAGTVATSLTAVITAALNGSSQAASLSLAPPVTVTALVCTPNSLNSGASSTCTVTTSAAAPAGGVLVAISSNNALLTAPASVTVAAGATTATFSATAGTIASDTTATVTAAANGGSASSTTTLKAPVTLSSVTCTPASLTGPGTSTCTVTLSGPVPTGGAAIALTSNNVSLTVPASVTIGAAATTGSFTATAGTVSSAQTAIITAALNGSSITASLSLAPPSTLTLSLTPSSGTGQSAVFTIVVTDPSGAADLNQVHLLVNSAQSGVGACYVYYSPLAKLLYLRNDANSGWLTPSLPPGSSGTVAGSQCTLNASSSTVSVSGNNLTLNVSVTFASSVLGTRKVYSYAGGVSGLNTGWLNTGSWTPSASAGPPTVVSLTPSSGSGQSVVFSAVVSDPYGAADLNQVRLLVNSGVNGVGACYVYYSPQAKLLYLRDDANAAWVAPSLTPGGSGTVANSQCTLSASSSTVSTSANNMVLNASITFASNLTSSRNVYLYAGGLSGLNSGWVNSGSWVPSAISSTASLSLAPPVTVTSLACTPKSLASATSSTCTVTLSAPAPAGGLPVTLSSNNPLLTTSVSATVTAGATTASFIATAGTISADQTAVLTGFLNGSSVTASLALASAASTTCPCSVWTPTAVPALISSADTAGVELGLKFRSKVAGYILGVRFYKGPNNTGTHSGHLWNVGGTLLASVTFANETSSGWQQANFSTPVAIAADTTYVISYRTPSGHYADDGGYFASSGVDNGPLHAMKDGEDGNNDVYTYTNTEFPASSFDASNYWVDVVFNTVPSATPTVVTSSVNQTNGVKTAMSQSALAAQVPVLPIARSSPARSLSCSPNAVRAGDSFTCELRLPNQSGSRATTTSVASSSSDVRLPAITTARAGQSSIKFRGTVANAAPQSVVTISTCNFGGNPGDQTEAQIAVPASPVPVFSLPTTLLVKSGEPISFRVLAQDPAGLPVHISASDLPAGASFEPSSRRFNWTPAPNQEGAYVPLFSAVNSTGFTSSAHSQITVGSGKPVIARSTNVACSPGSMATLNGSWLSLADEDLSDQAGTSTQLGGTTVRINGDLASVLYASPTRVDFQCPNNAAGSGLDISVETTAGATAPIHIVMLEANPVLLRARSSNPDQGQITLSGTDRLATIRDSYAGGEPAQIDDVVAIRATGLGGVDRTTGAVFVTVGGVDAQVQSVVPAPDAAGVFLINVRIPAAAPRGDAVPVQLEMITQSGRRLPSNTVTLAIE